MSDRLDQILDECIDRISLQGESVEDCLARYPDLATELEPHLRVVVMASQASAFTPSADAKALGHQRLQAELRALDQRAVKRREPRTSWARPVFGWQIRTVLIPLAIVLVLLVGSVSTVLASSSALPGDALYPVKRTAEQARLAFQFSQTGKAELYLTYSERRAEEISKLIKVGKFSQLEAAQKNLRDNLTATTRIAGVLQNEGEVNNLKSRLEVSASQVLASIQLAFQEAPEASREAASNTFQAFSEAFGDAIEVVGPRAPKVVAAIAPGTLRFWAVDPPPPDVEKVLVEVESIEAHLTRGDQSRWISITDEPQVFDLLRIAEVQRFLGEKMVEPGTYTRVRFLITKATVVVAAVGHPAKVPSERLDLIRPFRVEEGKTTEVRLDFDGLRSLKLTGQDEYIMKPVVRVFVKEPSEADQASQAGQAKGQPQTSRKELERSAKVQAPKVRIELEGVVEAVTVDSLTVKGKLISLSPDTKIDGPPEVGKIAKIEALIQPDGTLLATKIEMEHVKEKKDKTPEKPRATDQTQKPEKDQEQSRPPGQADVSVYGIIEFLDKERWVLNGHEIIINTETKIEETPSVGLRARVEGKPQPDGRILAESIKVLESPREPDKAPKEDRRPPDRTPTSSGDTSKKQDDIRIKGTIEEIGIDRWRVDGQTVVVSSETVVEDVPKVGANVQIEGVRQENGTVLAIRVKVLRKSGDQNKKTSPTPTPVSTSTLTPTPSPEPTATLTPKPGPTPTPVLVTVQLEGVLGQVQGLEWHVGGEVVVLSAETKIDGTLVAGSRVRIKGLRREDRTILATEVQILDTPGKPHLPDVAPSLR